MASSPSSPSSSRPAPPSTGQPSPLRRRPSSSLDSQSPPLPASPALEPVSPRGYSNISSLACSLEMARPALTSATTGTVLDSLEQPTRSSRSLDPSSSSVDLSASSSSEVEAHVHSQTQALMQMLSMVGSRFFEAEGEGVMEHDDEDGADDDDGDEDGGDDVGPLHSDSLVDEPVPIPSGRARSLRSERTWLGARQDLFDEQTTPRGGQTPLAASVMSLHKGKKLPSTAFGTSSDTLPRRNPTHGKRSDGPAALCSRHPIAETSIDTGEEGDSEDSGPELAIAGGPSSSASGMEGVLPAEALVSPVTGPTSTVFEQAPLQPPAQVLDAANAKGVTAGGGGSLHRGNSEEQLMVQLRRLFDLEPTEELVSAQRCWLFRSILLQGHVYLTTGHLCFYAYMPSKERRLLRSGPIGKLTRRTHRFSKHWATLKSGVFSWYDNARDPYFPQGFIDLRRASAVELSTKHPDRFKVVTPYRRFTFQVESEASRAAWVAALKKEVFKAHNEGESVKISVPLETIIDVDTALSVDSTEMVCVKVVDEQADFAMDEYFFLHLSRRNAFLEALRSVALDNVQGASDPMRWSRSNIHDSTSGMHNTVTLQTSLDEVPALPFAHSLKRQGSSASAKTMSSATTKTVAHPEGAARASMNIDRNDAASSRPLPADGEVDRLSSTPTAKNIHPTFTETSYIYPPSPSGSDPPAAFEQVQREVERGWAIPRWIKDTPAKVLGSGPAADAISGWMGGTVRLRHRRIVELWPKAASLGDLQGEEASADPAEDLGSGADDLTSSGYSTFSVLDAPSDEAITTEGGRFEEQYRDTFGLPEDERLLGHVHATLFRVLPITGRAFVSTRHLAFRSSGIASKTVGRTLMLIPLTDMVSAARHPAFRYGQHGIVITVRGHEEVFLEVASSERRDELLSLVDLQLDRCKADEGELDLAGADDNAERSHALVLRDLSEQLDHSFDSGSVTSSTTSSHLSNLGQSTSMMRSDSSALLSFKPATPMIFTMLTIGSRGDVQPYIALGKALQADGHRVRIASHPEFGDWVRGHGIEFSEIGGDPAELMRICVENGTFTVSFLREGVTKFRGWLDDLLLSSWQACQGSDVIIESPSAIAGIHVAEALQVPYYRAFTMPWTRTRAYPHAFAVPGNKAGGNYNYMSYVIFDQIFWRAAAGQINRWRKKHLGLRSTNIDKLEQHKVPFLYNFSPSLVPRPLDWFEWIHVTGFWFLDNPDNSSSRKWQPPADLVAFIHRARATQRKLVYIGWGSIVVSDAEAMTRCVLEAVKKSGVCAIISKGWSDRLSNPSKAGDGQPGLDPALLEDVYQVSSVPHDWLFPLIDAACHHGGAGTLGASLRAGLPTIVKPYFGDQFFWGQQVESLGVGSCVKKLTVDALAAALKTATTNAKQIEKARQLGAQIRAEDGVGEAVKAIYRDLDYARGQIKRDTRLPVVDPQLGETRETASEPVADPSSLGTQQVSDLSARMGANSLSDPLVAGSTPATSARYQATALTSPNRTGGHLNDQSSCSAEHTSDEWSDVGAPWSPTISDSQDDPSNSLVLATPAD